MPHTTGAAAYPSVRAHTSSRWPVSAGIFAGALLLVVSTVDGATRPGYEPLRHWVSHLALEERGWLGMASIIGCGMLLVVYAVGLRSTIQPSRQARFAARLVALTGIALAVDGVFPIDPGLGYPPGAQATYSISGMVHDLASLVVFASLAASAVLLGRCLSAPSGARLGYLVAAIVLASIIASSVLVGLDYAGTWPHAPSGLLEKVAVFTGLGWFAAVAAYLLRRSHR